MYCSRGYKWLCTAFGSWQGEFEPSQNRELKKFIHIYEKCTAIKQSPEIEEQIAKDIVRTFPNNIYFQKNNCGYFAMFKVLSAYSNLNELSKEQEEKCIQSLLFMEHNESSEIDSGKCKYN